MIPTETHVWKCKTERPEEFDEDEIREAHRHVPSIEVPMFVSLVGAWALVDGTGIILSDIVRCQKNGSEQRI
jgi:hypothetical protein